MKEGPADPISYDRRSHAVMLDRGRRDLLAWVSPAAVEPFSSLYKDAAKLAKVLRNPPSWRRKITDGGDNIVEWLDNNLILSAARKGRRADQLENILRSARKEDDGASSQMKSGRRALKDDG